jgi:hypothetical protein
MDNIIGPMRERVSFVNPTIAADGAAGRDYSYNNAAPFVTTWATVKDAGSVRVFDESGADRIIKRKTIKVWWRAALEAGLSKRTRIIYDGQNYQVENFTKEKEIKYILIIEAVS